MKAPSVVTILQMITTIGGRMDYAVNLEKKYFQHVLIIVVDQIARRFPSRCVITCLSLTPSLGPTELLDYCREKNCVQGKLSVSEFFFSFSFEIS